MITGNPELDFKEQNPIIASTREFTRIYNKRKDASKFCWAMWMIEETNQNLNPLAKIPSKEERKEEIKEYYDIDINCEDYKLLADYYSKFIITKEQALFKIQIEKLEELTARLKTMDLESSTDLDNYLKIMSKLPYIWNALDKIKDQMITSENKINVRGGSKLSKRDEKYNK